MPLNIINQRHFAPPAPKDPQADNKSLGGRPRKYSEPSRPVTVTLPESTLQALHRVSPDRGLAIVKLAQSVASPDNSSYPPVSIVGVAEDMGLIIVGPSTTLRSIPFVRLVEVAPLRYIIALERARGFSDLEIALNDALEDLNESEVQETAIVRELLSHIKELRKAAQVSMAEIVLVSLNDESGR